MKRFLKIFALLLLVALPLTFGKVALAQEEATTTTSIEEGDASDPIFYKLEDFDFEGSELFDEMVENKINEDSAVVAALGALFGSAFLVVVIIISLASYVYFSLTLQKVANKLGMDNSWYAWVPILNTILFFRMGDKSPWLILLALVPIVGGVVLTVITVIIMCTISEKRGYDRLLGLLSLVPIANVILWGILAWGDDADKPKKEAEVKKA